MNDFAVKLKLTGDSGDLQSAIDMARAKLDTLQDAVEDSPDDWRKAGDAIEDYSEELDDAGRRFDSFSDIARRGLVALTGVLTAATVAGGLMVRNTIENAAQLRLQTLNLNISAEALTRWQFAASKVGIESEKMSDIFKDVNDRVGDFARTGAGPLVDVIEQTSLRIEDLVRLSPDEQLIAIFEALDDIAGITFSEKTFFLESIAGDASRLIPLLDEGGAKFRELSDRAEELNIIMTDLDVEMLHIATQNADTLGRSIEGVANQFTIAMAPAIQAVTGYIDDLALANGGWGEVANDVARTVVAGFGFVLDVIQDVEKALLNISIAANKTNIFTLELVPEFAQNDNTRNAIEAFKQDLRVDIADLSKIELDEVIGSPSEQLINRFNAASAALKKQAEEALALRNANRSTSTSVRTLGTDLKNFIEDQNKATEASDDFKSSLEEQEAQLLTDAYLKHSADLERARLALTATDAELFKYDLSLQRTGKTLQEFSENDIRRLVNFKAQTDALIAQSEAEDEANDKRQNALETYNNIIQFEEIRAQRLAGNETAARELELAEEDLTEAQIADVISIKRLNDAREEAQDRLRDQTETYDAYIEKLEIENLRNLGLIDQARDLELSREIADEGLRRSVIERENYNAKVKESADLEKEFADIINGELTDSLTSFVDTGNDLLDKLIAKLIEAAVTGQDLSGIFGGVLGGGSSGGGGGIFDVIGGFFEGFSIPGFASGTQSFAGGLRIVGENGPELEATGASRIFNASDTAQILNEAMQPNGGNGGVNIMIDRTAASFVYVEQVSENDIRILANDEATKAINSQVISNLGDPNSPVSRGINQNTTAKRNRSR